MTGKDRAANLQIKILLIIVLASAATIAGAWYFQIVVDLVPCPLCLKGRWHHYAAIPITILALLLVRKRPDVSRILTIVIGFVFLAGAALSVYHAGIEYGFWPGPESCATGAGSPTNAAGLMSQMSSTRVVACDEVSWSLMGISLAGYNALLSLVLAALAFRSASYRTN